LLSRSISTTSSSRSATTPTLHGRFSTMGPYPAGSGVITALRIW
jgi:hypothetical protein